MLLGLLSLVLIVSSACQKKAAVPKQIHRTAEPQKQEFVPPSDSSVTMDQMRKWMQCNPYLDSLSIMYKDSFATGDAAKQTVYQEHFLTAQDKLCVRVGLGGGYTEYLWILKNIGNPKNAAVLESLKLTSYK
jgi:hypothetical protein